MRRAAARRGDRRYNVENVRVLACVAERLKQPGVKDITAYGGWPTVASRIWLISAAARSAQEVTPSAMRSASAELTACTEKQLWIEMLAGPGAQLPVLGMTPVPQRFQ